MSLEEARKKLLLVQYDLFHHGDLSQGSSIRITKKLLKVIEELEEEIARNKNEKTTPERDGDFQMVY